MTASRTLALFTSALLACCMTSCASGPTDILVIDDDLMRVTMFGAERTTDGPNQEIDVLLYKAEATTDRRFTKFQWALFHDLNRNGRLELSEGLTFVTASPAEPQRELEFPGSPTRASGRVWLEAVVLMENGEQVRRLAPVPGW